METKIVKCPKCGTLMRLSNKNEEAVIHFACPNCNTQLNVSFNVAGRQRQAPQQPAYGQQPYGSGPATVYSGSASGAASRPAANGSETHYESGRGGYGSGAAHDNTLYEGGAGQRAAHPSAGYIVYGSIRLPLQPGCNIVGRKASTSHANVQIPTADHYMSRHHLRIDVVDVGTGRYRVLISNAENKNPTYVNGQLLGQGEQFILADGATIRMGETTVAYTE